jgi:hypothetical protein
MKHRTGRVAVAFEELARFAEAERSPLFADMDLSRKSSVTRCKNGSLTVCLMFTRADGLRGTQTMRGVREAGRTK